MTSTRSKRLLTALENNWQAEMEGQARYRALAQRETDAERRMTLQRLAAAEQHHAELWAERLRAIGGRAPVYRGHETGNADALPNRIGGDDLALRRLEIEESRDIEKYARQITELGDEPSVAVLREVLHDEREHYQALRSLIHARGPLPTLTPEEAQEALDSLLAARRKGRRTAASWVGDAIYGVNDGLGSIFGIVSGVSGATTGNSRFVLIAGLAGMVASALSMGSGAFLAAKSQREIHEAEFARERETVEYNEGEAREVLALSYQIKGLPEDDARRLVDHLAQDRERFVNALARERMRTTEEGLGRPTVAALSGALSTAIGAFIPIVPFFFMAGMPAIVTAAAISLAAHFAVGAAKALVTMRPWWSSGLEMTLVGAAEGVVTYGIGLGLGRMGGH